MGKDQNTARSFQDIAESSQQKESYYQHIARSYRDSKKSYQYTARF